MRKVYLVGAGPGDPGLITLRALELIRNADTIIYDYLVNNTLLSQAKPGARLLYVGKQASRHELPQPEINRLLVDTAEENKVVVRLKGGDPFIFGRGGEEAMVLSQEGIAFEIVPGVTSAIAVPAYAGIPLTHRDHASTVALVTGHEDERKESSTINWDDLAHAVDTLVFLMGIRNLPEIRRRLLKAGKDPATPVAIIEWGTLPRQRVVTGTLLDIDVVAKKERVRPPGIIVVGDVVALRKDLQWFEKRPFFGKRIGITRAAHQSPKLGEMIAQRGGEPVFIPTIEIAPIEPNKRLGKTIEGIETYSHIVFTSVNAVDVFFKALLSTGRDGRRLSGRRIVAIGPATAARLRENGIVADVVPQTFTSRGIVDALKTEDLRGRKVLLPRAQEASGTIVRFVRAEGGHCEVIPIYRTGVPADPCTMEGVLDVVTFTSSSTVKNFMELYGKEAIDGVRIASIGPITTRTLRSFGLTVHIEAAHSHIPGLVDAMEKDVRAEASP